MLFYYSIFTIMELLDDSTNEMSTNVMSTNECQKKCDHSFITDYIDVDYGEKSIRICYCEKCFLDRTNLTVTTNSIRTTST